MKKETKNTISRTAKTIADATANLEAAKKKYSNAIASCEKAADAAEEKMASALAMEDGKAYASAKMEKEAAEAEREMYQRRMAQIENEGLMSEAEVNQIVDALKAAEREEFMALATETRNMSAKLIELKRDYDAALKELNELAFSIPMVKTGAVSKPLAIRVGDPALSYAAYAERYLQNYKFS